MDHDTPLNPARPVEPARDDATPDLLIIGLCERCARQVRTRGGPSDWVGDESTFEIV